jgi:hypothetical protein
MLPPLVGAYTPAGGVALEVPRWHAPRRASHGRLDRQIVAFAYKIENEVRAARIAAAESGERAQDGSFIHGGVGEWNRWPSFTEAEIETLVAQITEDAHRLNDPDVPEAEKRRIVAKYMETRDDGQVGIPADYLDRRRCN